MNLILLSTDTNILRQGSSANIRLSGYGVLADRVDIVLFAPHAEQKTTEIGERVFVHSIPGAKPVAAFRALVTVRKLSARQDCVLSVQDPFELGIIGLIASKAFELPLHVQVHIDFFSEEFKSESYRQRIQSLIAPLILRNADRIRVVSRRIKQYVVEVLDVNEELVDCVPVASIVSEPAHIVKDDSLIKVLMMSRLVKQKRVPDGIHAFAAAYAKHQNAKLLIVGDGPELSSVQKAIDAHPECSDSVEVRGWTDEPAREISASDIFLLPSGYEGWGMTAIEASALGVPVLMTDVGCADEALRDDIECLIVPVGDRQKLAESLGRLVGDRALRERLGATAKNRATEYVDVARNHSMLGESLRATLGK